jgi:dihydrofolate synthase/folylpolyglutamate synthase
LDLGGFGANGAVIVGSNGKGSTAAMIAALLQQVSGPVGLFTSPHLFALNERFRIDGEDIADDALAYHWARVVDATVAAGLDAQLGGFEFLFLIAADWFAARGCKHTVWEAGIGGRLDPTALIAARRLALTALDLEHTALLGDTLEAIALEKLGAAPAGASVFAGASCSALRAVIEAHCVGQGIVPVFTGTADAPLPGAHQRGNAALAIALARDLARLSDTDIRAGLAATNWPGRLEAINQDPLIVIDVGHTPAAIRAALAGFESMAGGGPHVLVCGASHDKSASDMIAALGPSFATIICAAARHKGTPPGEIAAYASAANPGAEIIVAESVAEARGLALSRARTLGGAIYVAGGLFLAAEFKAVHLGRDPASLAFF